MGDMITAKCLSPVSEPAPVLTWYINSDTADTGLISGPRHTVIMMEDLDKVNEDNVSKGVYIKVSAI